MNQNVLGGTAALIALGAIFYIASKPAAPVAPPVVNPAPVATKPVAVPAPKPEIKIEPKAETKPVVALKIKFYRVEQGGKQGPLVECRDVKAFADGKSPAELATLAKQYGVTESDLKRYFICTN